MNNVALSATDTRVGFWQRPLGYPHAFASGAMALAVGLAFHFFVGYHQLPVLFAAIGAIGLVCALFAGRVFRTNVFVHWLTGIPFAVVSTASVSALALVGGVVPESVIQSKFGAPSIWASWPFLFVCYLMMVNLVGSAGKRCWPLNYTNFVYVSTHAGLAIALGGGAFSSLSLERWAVVMHEGVPTSVAQNSTGVEVKLPFKLTLREFALESFPPVLAFATLDDASPDGMSVKPGSNFIRQGMAETIEGIQVEILRYFPRAVLDGNIWHQVEWKSAAPAALVRAKLKDGTIKEGWVSCGSSESSGALLAISERSAIVMPDSRPKKFRSVFDITQRGETKRAQVEVNDKLSYGGYDIYQLSYDERAGAASQYSVLEVVKDRGLPIVYAGIFLMLLGCVLHLGNGVGGKK